MRLKGGNVGTFSEETGSCRRVLSGAVGGGGVVVLNQTYVLRKPGAHWAYRGGLESRRFGGLRSA